MGNVTYIRKIRDIKDDLMGKLVTSEKVTKYRNH
jgi:hypothetical protein